MVERVAILRSSTAALITITILLTITFSLIFLCSQEVCSFVIWTILFIICCIFLLPVIILRTVKGKIELSGPSSVKLYRLLRLARQIQIIQGDTEIVVKNHYTISDTTIKWYETYSSKIYNVVEGIKAGDSVLVDGVKLVLI